MPKTKVLLADDHAIVTEGLEALLKDTFDLVGVVHDGFALLDAVDSLAPDVIVTDISMPQLNGIDAIRQIKARRSDAKIVVLSMHRDTQLVVDALRAGALGYVLKVSPGEELIQAITQVGQGRAFVTSLVSKDVLSILLEARQDAGGDNAPLTTRQRQVLQLIAEGRTMKEVATMLNISPRTAESHKYEIMQVLGVKTTAALIQCAMRLRLVAE
jgi:DNA-binding NarL/FixJ family response regulator